MAPIRTLEPDEAARAAAARGLIVRKTHPLNGEIPIPGLDLDAVGPQTPFYVRNHFPIPRLQADAFEVVIGGLVERPFRVSVSELERLQARTLAVTLECAGNGRVMFDRPTDGEQWQLGAVSTAEWTGVPLVELLRRAQPRAEAREVVFRGADTGMEDGAERRYERSLPLDAASDPDVLLAYAMNGEPLPPEHGHPLRLIVPRWYAMASVKWLTGIDLVDAPFGGHFQADKYCYQWEREDGPAREPVRLQRVRALITRPGADERLHGHAIHVQGVAWSGAAPVARVEVCVVDGGWQDARFVDEGGRYAWRRWEATLPVSGPGVARVRARATDTAGNTQPERAEWNRLGYGNNAIQEVSVRVVDPA